MQIAAEASGKRNTGVYYWEPLCIPGKTYGSWDENMGMLDTDGHALPSFEVYKNFDREKMSIDALDNYIASLYEVDETEFVATGTNIIENGDFSRCFEDWWITKDDTAVCEIENQEVLIESKSNFKLELFRDVYVSKPGKYTFSVEYRGTNTTGVKVEMFLRVISFDGELIYKEDIFPSDVRFVVHKIENIELAKGQIQLGIRIDSPPITGRIRNFQLFEEKN